VRHLFPWYSSPGPAPGHWLRLWSVDLQVTTQAYNTGSSLSLHKSQDSNRVGHKFSPRLLVRLDSHFTFFIWHELHADNNFTFITALHGMQTRSCDENSVRPSVRLSVKRVNCDKTEERCVYIIRKNIYPSFLRRRMVGGGRPLLPEILGRPARVGAKSLILNR